MRPIGAECTLAIEIDGARVSVPFTEETLRPLPLIEEREPLLGKGAPAYGTVRGATTTGCIVTRVGRGALPALLRVCMGQAEAPAHVPESRGMFSTEFRLADRLDGLPSFDLVADRGVERLRYGKLKAAGFELRGRLDEPLYLRLDVSGSGAVSTVDGVPALVDEEHFYFEPGSVVVDGVAMSDVYEFALTVDTGLRLCAGGRARNGKKSVGFAMHAPLDEAVVKVAAGGRHTVELRFALASTFPEPDRTAELSWRCEDVVVLKEQKEPDSPYELCSPYLFAGRGAVTARVVREEAGL